jgi:hypothetical protein
MVLGWAGFRGLFLVGELPCAMGMAWQGFRGIEIRSASPATGLDFHQQPFQPLPIFVREN